MSIGTNIKKVRKAVGYTQAELGKKLGITAATISAFEHDKTNIKYDTVCKIADALDVPTAMIFYDDCPTDKVGGEILNELLKEKGISVDELSKMIDMPTTQIELIITGNLAISSSLIEKLAKAFDVSFITVADEFARRRISPSDEGFKRILEDEGYILTHGWKDEPGIAVLRGNGKAYKINPDDYYDLCEDTRSFFRKQLRRLIDNATVLGDDSFLF